MPIGYIWDFFIELHSKRGASFGGPLGIPYSEILAWKTLMKRRIDPWEVEIIQAIDATFLASCSEARRNNDANE